MQSDTFSMIDALRTSDAARALEAFNRSMQSKVNAALDERKIVVAGQIYNKVQQEGYMGGLDAIKAKESPEYQKQAFIAKRFSLDAHKSGTRADHGSAGYEHRLAAKLAKSPEVQKAHTGASDLHQEIIAKLKK